jgi:hypothetical protein
MSITQKDKFINEEDIVRYRNDTYPITGSIEENNNPVDLSDGWNVYMWYIEEDKLIQLDAIITNPKKGTIVIYPTKDYCKDITDQTNPVAMQAFTKPGKYDYTIVRSRIVYRKNDDGDYVEDNGTYREFDPATDAGKQRYVKIDEKVTHSVGKIIVSDRVGL